MPKQTFDPTDEAIWESIVGNKGFLPSARTENLVDILERDLGLHPIVIRVGDGYDLYKREFFYKLHIRDRSDGFCRVFYHPEECAMMSGSNAHNWLQWASKLLGYGRASHDLAPRFGLENPVRNELVARGVSDGGRVTRLISLELVTFYLASQITTWGNPARIFTIKDRLLQQGIQIKSPSDCGAEDIDVDSILPEDPPATAEPPPKRSRYPKAAQGMRGYNPAKSTPETPNVLDIEDMTDDDLSLLASRLMAVVSKRQQERAAQERRQHAFEEQAKAIRILGGMVMPDRGEFATITATYKSAVHDVSADTLNYVRTDLLPDAVLTDLVAKGFLP